MARFLDEFSNQYVTFNGSMIIVGDSIGDEFVSIALLINQGPTGQGLMSVIPVILGIITTLP
jgi:hypothetical protein